MSDWNSEQYLKFKNERTQPSTDLVNTIKLETPKRIIDIGCGPGNSTRALKNKYPEAEIFSNACIQWVPNHKKLLADMMNALNPNGVLAVQVPITVEQDMHRVIKNVTGASKWKEKLYGSRVFYTLADYEYFDILSDLSNDFRIWKTIYCHRMPTHRSILEWYSSTGLKPYFDKLNDGESVLFEKDILDEIEKQFPVQKNGEIIFRFPRLFFTAVK